FNVKTGTQSRLPVPINKWGGDRANLIPIGDTLLVTTKSRLTLLGPHGEIAAANGTKPAETTQPDPL
ncbi:MAG: hypothetical protein ACR2NU_14860, partial [Aeoliella sp.]